MPLASHTIDVKQFIDGRRFSVYQWLVIALCFLILTVDAYDIVAIGYAAPSLIWRVAYYESTAGQCDECWRAGNGTVGALLGGALSDWKQP